MRGKISVLAIMLALLILPIGNLYSLNAPYGEGPENEIGGGGPEGDDHPWGGDNGPGNDGDIGRPAINKARPVIAVGVPPIDLLFSSPYIGRYIQSIFFTSVSLLVRTEPGNDEPNDRPTIINSRPRNNGDF